MTGDPNQHHVGRVRVGQQSSREPSSGSEARERTAFGLDLGGYSAGRSALVRATCRTPTEVQATVYRGHALSKKPGRGKPLASIVEKEIELLAACLRGAPLYADVPIDLQGLPCPGGEIYTWQLVKRPVDLAFGALPPLADRIGSVVARFRNILRLLPENHPAPLDDQLYETYPAGSLRLLKLPYKGYKDDKDRITSEGDTWHGSGPKGRVLARIANGLRISGTHGEMLSHDDLDAVLCALTGVVDQSCLLQEKELGTAIGEAVGDDRVDPTPPKAYVLMKHMPEELTIVVSSKTVRDDAEMLEAVAEE